MSRVPDTSSDGVEVETPTRYFETTAAARRAGKDALNELLNKLFA